MHLLPFVRKLPDRHYPVFPYYVILLWYVMSNHVRSNLTRWGIMTPNLKLRSRFSYVRARSGSQKIPRILRKLTSAVRYHVHRNSPLVPTLNHINPVIFIFYLFRAHFIINLSSIPACLKWNISFRTYNQNFEGISHIVHVCTFPSHLNLLDFIALIFGGE